MDELFITDLELTQDEKSAYLKMGKERLGDNLKAIEIKSTDDPEMIDIRFVPNVVRPFERIRRITGYLVGTLDRFNDAKRAEEADRVKHQI